MREWKRKKFYFSEGAHALEWGRAVRQTRGMKRNRPEREVFSNQSGLNYKSDRTQLRGLWEEALLQIFPPWSWQMMVEEELAAVWKRKEKRPKERSLRKSVRSIAEKGEKDKVSPAPKGGQKKLWEAQEKRRRGS